MADKKLSQKSGQYQTFSDALRKVLLVSHSEVKKQLAEEKKARTSARSSSGRASHAK